MPTKTVATLSQREGKTWSVSTRRYFRENNDTSAPDGTTPQNPTVPAAQPAATPAEQPDKGSEKASRIKQLSDEAAKNRVELKTVKGELTTIKQQLEQARQEQLVAMREAAAAKHGLPAELAARLQGDKKEDIEKDAEALAKIIPQPTTVPTKPSSPANPGGTTKLTPEAIRLMTPQEVVARWDEVQAAIKK